MNKIPRDCQTKDQAEELGYVGHLGYGTSPGTQQSNEFDQSSSDWT
jgi:hypothetical protein